MHYLKLLNSYKFFLLPLLLLTIYHVLLYVRCIWPHQPAAGFCRDTTDKSFIASIWRYFSCDFLLHEVNHCTARWMDTLWLRAAFVAVLSTLGKLGLDEYLRRSRVVQVVD
jgi:hypothetical protein